MNKNEHPTNAIEAIRRGVELATGKSISELREMPLDEQLASSRQRWGSDFRISSAFPILGRGCVMHDRVLTRQQIDKQLDQALSRL